MQSLRNLIHYMLPCSSRCPRNSGQELRHMYLRNRGEGFDFLSTRYSACSKFGSLVRKGTTLKILWCVVGVFGISSAIQKSSANLPVR